MDRVGEFRELAVQCALMASTASSESQKRALLDMARRWSDLADQIENTELAIHTRTEPLGDSEP